MRLLIGGTPTGTLRHISVDVYRRRCGMLTSWRSGSHPRNAIKIGAPWAMDNFAFTGFDADRFFRSLSRYTGLPGCLFVAAPDVVRDAQATASLFDRWYDTIKRFGYPIALVAQDGLEQLKVEWQSIDALFVGGSEKFKYSEFVAELTYEARLRRKWTHMGRVNSPGRWRYCEQVGFDSCDGTGMSIKPARVKEALAVLDNPGRPLWQWKPAYNMEDVI